MSSKDKRIFDERRCRVCGCTEDDCSACIKKTGHPCHWVDDDLCSACAGNGVPKTGLAGRLRDWMKAQKRPFQQRDIYLALGITDTSERNSVYKAVRDFKRRGEVVQLPPDKRNRRQNTRYRYAQGWKGSQAGSVRPRIYKAMYVAGTFTANDIIRLCQRPGESVSRDWIDKIIRRLRKSGYLNQVGRRPCAHGAGAESIYHVTDRDRFRLEVMG